MIVRALHMRSLRHVRPRQLIVIVGTVLCIPLALTLADPTSHLRGGSGGGWDWTLPDFIIMGGLLFSTALAGQIVLMQSRNMILRITLMGAIVLFFLAVWSELGVSAVSKLLGL